MSPVAGLPDPAGPAALADAAAPNARHPADARHRSPRDTEWMDDDARVRAAIGQTIALEASWS